MEITKYSSSPAVRLVREQADEHPSKFAPTGSIPEKIGWSDETLQN
jgi:hypothetical protein